MNTRARTAALLIVLVLAVFLPVLGHDFVHYDDFDYVVQNPLLRMSWFDAFQSSFIPQQSNWIPITWLSLRFDYALFGLLPAGYHATNLALHALASIILYLLLARITEANGRSLFVAACFAVHPLHVESVAWVAERKDVLAGFFWMLTMWCYVRYCEKPRDVQRYLFVMVSLCLGLLAKPVVVTLPFVLLLLDYWPLGRLSDKESGGWPRLALVGRAILEKTPLFALVLAVSVVTYYAQLSSMKELEALSLPWRLANAVVSYGFYLRDAVWPTQLAVFYPHPLETLSLWHAALTSVILAAVTAALARLAPRYPYAIVGWLWFLGTLVPMLGVMQVGMQARADRYMYLPLVGLSIIVAWGAVDLAKRYGVSEQAQRVAGTVVILLFAAFAWVQVGTWRDTESIYTRALDATEANHVAHKGLGNELLRQGRIESAVHHYETAIRIKPDWQPPRLGLIDAVTLRGSNSQALSMLRDELKRTPDNPDVYGRYGVTLGGVGRYKEARPYLQRVVRARPGVAELRLALSQVERTLGNLLAAVTQGRESLRLAPGSVEAANNLAWILATARDPAFRDPGQAIRLIEAAALESSNPAMLDTLAAAYAASGRHREAAAIADRAATLEEETGSITAARDYRQRAAQYAAGKPYIEPGPNTTTERAAD